MALLMAMDLEHFATVPANPDDLVYWFQTFRSPTAANIQFVFYASRCNRGNKDVLVKVLLNEEDASIGNLVPVEGPYYRWADVREFLLDRVASLVSFKPAMPN